MCVFCSSGRHDALKLGKDFAKLANCSAKDIVCLLSLSPQAVLAAQMKSSKKISPLPLSLSLYLSLFLSLSPSLSLSLSLSIPFNSCLNSVLLKEWNDSTTVIMMKE